MLEQDEVTARLCAAIEEELGTFQRFMHVPATEIEEMATRLARAVAPFVGERTVSRAA